MAYIWRENMHRYLSLSVPRCEQIMSKDNYTSMFSRKIEVIQIFFNARGKNSLRTAYNLPCNIFSLSAFWYELWTNKYFTSSLTTTKRSYLKLNFKRGLIEVDVRFENLGISLGWYPRISHSLARGYSVTWCV